jgi:RNA polymerase sigma-70 factor (ECF subfamily)
VIDPDLSTFCRCEWPRLVGTLSLYTGDGELAQDLAQETLARVCRDWPTVSRLDAPGAWAHKVALNLARSHFRHRAVARRLGHRVATSDRAEEPNVVGAIVVRAALRDLPDRQRMAVVLRYFADLSVAETAEAMRCPEGTVKTLTREAILALRSAGLITNPDTDEEPMADVK